MEIFINGNVKRFRVLEVRKIKIIFNATFQQVYFLKFSGPVCRWQHFRIFDESKENKSIIALLSSLKNHITNAI